MSRAAVLGAGAWGTAFAKMLAEAGARRHHLGPARVGGRRDPRAARQRGRAARRSSCPTRITATSDLAAAVDGAELIAIAVPSQTLRGNLADWAGACPPDSTLISLMKGIELGTTKRMSQVIVETARVDAGPGGGRLRAQPGPRDRRRAARRDRGGRHRPGPRPGRCSRRIALPYLRPYTSEDVIGCEMGGAVKNVIALAYGMAAAMGMGDNTKASLITRGLAETARLGVALGADPLTFAGLAGLGDLVATCSSPLSRNRTFGEHLGRGEIAGGGAARPPGRPPRA